MRHLLLCCLITITAGVRAINELTVDSKISQVTVFLNGAQLTRETKIKIPKGNSTVIIDNVSPYIHPKSIQAWCSGQSIILDVKHNIKHLEPDDKKSAGLLADLIGKQEDSLNILLFELEKISASKENLRLEKDLLLNHKILTGDSSTDSLELLTASLQFYRSQLENIENQLLRYKLNENVIRKNKTLLQQKISDNKNFLKNTEKSSPLKKIHQVILTLSAEAATECSLKVDYLTDNASWKPSYDVRADENNKEISLNYKATVIQKTGENWENVTLKLSTYNQQCNFSVPSLAMWELWDKKHNTKPAQSQLGYGNFKIDEVQLSNSAISISPSHSGLVQDFSLDTIIPGEIGNLFENVEFEIAHRYNIISGEDATMMLIKKEKLNATFTQMSIPKINKDVFLLANITGWKNLNLLQAEASIYYKNTYIGETFIDPNGLNDTLKLALNREKKIATSRRKISDKEKTTLGKKNIRTITIELLVQNNKKTEVAFNLVDQIPVSRHDNIEIKLKHAEGATLIRETGQLDWHLQLPPNGSKIVQFTYEIAYDKELNIL